MGRTCRKTRLPESDQGTIDVYPLLTGPFSNGLPDVGIDTDGGRVERWINRSLLKISMFKCDSLERHIGDPIDAS